MTKFFLSGLVLVFALSVIRMMTLLKRKTEKFGLVVV